MVAVYRAWNSVDYMLEREGAYAVDIDMCYVGYVNVIVAQDERDRGVHCILGLCKIGAVAVALV